MTLTKGLYTPTSNSPVYHCTRWLGHGKINSHEAADTGNDSVSELGLIVSRAGPISMLLAITSVKLDTF